MDVRYGAHPFQYVFHWRPYWGLFIYCIQMKGDDFYVTSLHIDSHAIMYRKYQWVRNLFTLDKHINNMILLKKKCIHNTCITIVIIVVQCKSENMYIYIYYYIRPNRFSVGLRLLISTVRLRLSEGRREEMYLGTGGHFRTTAHPGVRRLTVNLLSTIVVVYTDNEWERKRESEHVWRYSRSKYSTIVRLDHGETIYIILYNISTLFSAR